MIRKLNPILRGWASHFRHAAGSQTFSYLGNYVLVAGRALASQEASGQDLEVALLPAGIATGSFEVTGMTLYKRLTFIARGRRIVRVFYPVFPPDENPEQVLEWIHSEAPNY